MNHGTTRVYLVRHGQVQGHEEKRYNGHADVGLTEFGLSQYHRLTERLAGVSIAACYSSDLQRCRLGAEILGRHFRVTPQLEPGLRELDIGLWEGKTWQELMRDHPVEWQARLADIVNYRVPEGENLLDLQARSLPVLQGIVACHRGEAVLVVAHGGTNRVLLLDAIGAPLTALFNIEQSYGCLNIIDYYADGRATVQLLNGG